MKRMIILALLAALALFVVAGCASPAKNKTVQPTDQPYAPVIDPANFIKGIDNPYFPLKPGTTFVYEGKTEKGNEHNETNVTSETKVILGVTCVVVSDTVTLSARKDRGRRTSMGRSLGLSWKQIPKWAIPIARSITKVRPKTWPPSPA